ncbi:MAG: DUF1552 domain-containing protein [Planctomycetota bacterium]
MTLDPLRLGRRSFLRGLGCALALPLLESMGPSARARTLFGATPSMVAAPRRVLFVFVPNGVHRADWAPADAADGLGPILEPLAPHRSRFTIITGLAHRNATALGDGPGDHARSAACFLTGAHPVKTAGAGIAAGVSADQIIAQHFAHTTRFPSLELGCEAGMDSGQCDSGYSCAYSANISWRTPHSPVSKEVRPRLVFERLFQVGPATESAVERAARLHSRRSILDFVSGEAQRLHAQLGTSDRRKLAEYLDGVRGIERRLEQVENHVASAEAPSIAPPSGIPTDYAEHVRLLFDMIVLAFKLDLTRVATFMYANEGSNRSFPTLGISDGHHSLSHHGGDAAQIAHVRAINRHQCELFGQLLARLDAEREGDATLLDNSMVVYASAIGDGNRHNHDDLPVLLAGGGGGTLAPGQRLVAPADTPFCNLLLALMARTGVELPRFGDSTGSLAGI